MKLFKKFLICCLTLSLLQLPCQKAKADSSHEFIMSVTYGTLAGALLGAASLAFTNNPGDKLQRIARGASLGLYAGILLGVYVIYLVPDENDELNRILPDENGMPESRLPLIYPTISDNGKIDGAAFQIKIFRF